jgi:hypothetical protein
VGAAFERNVTRGEVVTLPVLAERDAAPGRALLFATYTSLMDLAERTVLCERVFPRCPAALADHRSLIERETYYFERTYAGQALDVHVGLGVAPASGESPDAVVVGELFASIEVYRSETGTLVAASRSHKALVVPRAHASLILEGRRWCSRFH